MATTLPENHRIQRDTNYKKNSYSQHDPIPATTKFRVLADTGWYYHETNADAEPDTPGVSRYRVVLVPGEKDPIVINDGFSVTTPGGTFDLQRGFVRAKDQTPYLSHYRWITSSHGFGRFLTDRETKSNYMHPRFTALKAWMREILRVENKRDAYIRKAREKATIEAKSKYPFVIDKLTGETL